jgi:hypothetical protein
VNDDEEIPYIIFETTVEIRPLLEQNHSVVTLPEGFPWFVIAGSLYMLRKMNLSGLDHDLLYEGWVKRVHIVSLGKRYKGYFGITKNLLFDPGRYAWKNLEGSPLSYMAKKVG